jgi:hypothetical protein
VAWRLAWRQQRWELAILIGGSLLLAAAMVFVAWQMDVTNEGVRLCTASAPSAADLTPACRSLIWWGNAWTGWTPVFIGLATVAPFLVGLLLGAPLLAREIEKRTASMAWTLSRSRRRWLAGRVLPVAVLVAIALLLVGQASSVLQDVAYPDGRGFMDYGSRGLIIPARGLAMFGIGVAVGLVSGRVLPAILISGLVAVAIFGVVEYGRSELLRAEATWIEVGNGVEGEDTMSTISMVYDQQFIDDATGERMTFEQAYERYPDVFNTGPGIPPGMTMAYLATPPGQYPWFVARESAVLLGLALVGGVVATVMIGSRRPE